MEKQKLFYYIKAFSKQSIGILLGSIIFGIGLSWFLVPFKVAPGGVGGLSQLLFHFFGWNVGLSMIVMNIPLWIIGMILIGRQFGIGTGIGFFVSSLMIDLVSPKRLYDLGLFKSLIEKYNTIDGVLRPYAEWAMTDDIFLATIAGAMLLGIGLGIIFKSKASTGGTDIPVALMKKKLNISIGNGYLIVETAIILFTGIMFADLNLIIWSYFALFLSSKFADMITEGISRVKAAHIICNDDSAVQRITERIYKEMDRGVTFINGEGSYSGKDKQIIYVTFNIRQAAVLKNIAKQEDPNVFMITQDVHDVIGFGFKSREIEIE